MQFVFKGNTHHDKVEYVKGQLCPDELLHLMQGKKLVEALPEAVKPVAAPPVKSDPRPNLANEKKGK